jgi:hypothetical protein
MVERRLIEFEIEGNRLRGWLFVAKGTGRLGAIYRLRIVMLAAKRGARVICPRLCRGWFAFRAKLMSMISLVTTTRENREAQSSAHSTGKREACRNARIGPFESNQESNPQTLNFTAKRNGGNCYEHTNANERCENGYSP